jgi:hypothetical protein
LSEHYANDVIGGAGAFMMTAESRAEFAEAILKKLILEVADARPTGPLAATMGKK